MCREGMHHYLHTLCNDTKELMKIPKRFQYRKSCFKLHPNQAVSLPGKVRRRLLSSDRRRLEITGTVGQRTKAHEGQN